MEGSRSRRQACCFVGAGPAPDPPSFSLRVASPIRRPGDAEFSYRNRMARSSDHFTRIVQRTGKHNRRLSFANLRADPSASQHHEGRAGLRTKSAATRIASRPQARYRSPYAIVRDEIGVRGLGSGGFVGTCGKWQGGGNAPIYLNGVLSLLVAVCFSRLDFGSVLHILNFRRRWFRRGSPAF